MPRTTTPSTRTGWTGGRPRRNTARFGVVPHFVTPSTGAEKRGRCRMWFGLVREGRAKPQGRIRSDPTVEFPGRVERIGRDRDRVVPCSPSPHWLPRVQGPYDTAARWIHAVTGGEREAGTSLERRHFLLRWRGSRHSSAVRIGGDHQLLKAAWFPPTRRHGMPKQALVEIERNAVMYAISKRRT